MDTPNKIMESFFNLITLVPDGMDEVESFSFQKVKIKILIYINFKYKVFSFFNFFRYN